MKLVNLRWLILVVFMVHVSVTASNAAAPLVLVWLAALGFASCALLLSALTSLSWQNLWAWIILFVFVDGYYVKTLVLAGKINSPSEIATFFPDLRWVTEEVVTDGQVWMAAAFVSFAVVSWFLLMFRGPESEDDPIERRESEPRSISSRRVTQLSCATFGAYLLVSLLQNRLGLGVLGQETSGGILSTLLTRFRADLVPGILLLCLWLQGARRSSGASVTLVFLLSAGLVDSLISTSRGSIPRFVLPALFLWVITRRFGAKQVAFCLCGALAALVLFPIVSGLRAATLAERSGDVRAVSEGPSISLVDSASFALLRVQGAEGIWLSLNRSPSGFEPGRAASFLAQGSNSNFYTKEVVGVVKAGDYRAPGIVGGFMLLGPVPLVMALMVLYVFLASLTTNRLARFESGPAALSLFASWLLYSTSEGTFYMANVVVLVLVVCFCELLVRKNLFERTGATHDAVSSRR